MVEVKFEEESIPTFQHHAPTGPVGWVMKIFDIESENQAAKVLLGFIVICFLLSGFIIFISGSSQELDLPKDPRTGEVILEGRRPGYY